MNADTDLLDRIQKKNPELIKPALDMFAAIRKSDDDSGIDALDLSTPRKPLQSDVCVPETPSPSPIFSRTSSKRERNDNPQIDGNTFSKRTCQFECDRFESSSTKLFSKYKREDARPTDDGVEQLKSSSRADGNTKEDNAVEQLNSSARDCDSNSVGSPVFKRKTVTDSDTVELDQQRCVIGKRLQKKTNLKKADRSNVSTVSPNSYKNSRFGTGYKGWPSDSDTDSDDDDILLSDITRRAPTKTTNHEKETKLKSLQRPESNVCTNDLDLEQNPSDEKEKSKNRNSQKDVADSLPRRKKRLFIPRSELPVRNAFSNKEIRNSGQSLDNGRSFRPPDLNPTNSRQLPSCRFANTIMNKNTNSVKEIASRSDSSETGLTCPISIANQDQTHISPTFLTSNQICNTFSNANHVSPTYITSHRINLTDEADSVTDLTATQNAGIVQSCSPCRNSGHNRNIKAPGPTYSSPGFINLHPELEDRASCMYSSMLDRSNQSHDATSHNVVLLDSDHSDGYQQPAYECSPTRRHTRAGSRRKTRASSGFRRWGDVVSSQFHHRPDNVIHLDDNVEEMNNAVSLARQLENDEEYAKRLQEEMDKEFAMSLHHQSHTAVDGAHYTHFDVDGTGIPPAMLPVFQAHALSPVRRRGYNSNRQPNTRSRRRHRGSDEDLVVDGMSQEPVMLPFHQRGDMDESNPLTVMMQAHILALLENTQSRRGRRRGVGGRGPRNLLFGFGHTGEGNDYEELLQLAENLGDVKSKGISTAEINRLPTRDYKKPDGQGESEECNICMSEYKEGDRLRILTCFHEFHAKCIDKWLKSNATCPVCRVDVRS